MSLCGVISCFVGRLCLLWPVHSLGKTLLAFAMIHFVLQFTINLTIEPVTWVNSSQKSTKEGVKHPHLPLKQLIGLKLYWEWCCQIFVYAVFSSVQSVVSDSLWPHEAQHTRPPCPSPTHRVHPNPCPSSRWCHPTISSTVLPFSSCKNLSQHQGLFKWVSSSHQVAKVLEFQL